jgi:1,4-alpha-glucan branching enzyme
MKLRKLKTVPSTRPTSMKAVLPPEPAKARATHGVDAVPLKLVAPAARQVYVAGSFNNWHAAALPLKASGGEWTGELKLAPGRYEYLFVVDGQWLPDPSAPEKVPNPFGGYNSLLSVT